MDALKLSYQQKEGLGEIIPLKNLVYCFPFGMLLPNRNGSEEDYRYGFQGQEMDDEVKGEGNSVNYTFRMHDPRVGRFFAVDPLTADYPHYTPYSFSGNKVIHAIELEGMEEYFVNPQTLDVLWNIFGRSYDQANGNVPHVMFLTLGSTGNRQTVTRPLIEVERGNVNHDDRKAVKTPNRVATGSVDVDGPAPGSENGDVVRVAGGGGLSTNVGAVGMWPPNSVQTNAAGNAVGGGAVETFNAAVPGGGGDPALFARLDFNVPGGVGGAAAANINLTLTDNTGTIIYNGPPVMNGNVPIAANITGITATITNNNAAATNYMFQLSIAGTDAGATTIERGSSAGQDENNANPSNPGTTVSNTGVNVNSAPSGSSSSDPLNELDP